MRVLSYWNIFLLPLVLSNLSVADPSPLTEQCHKEVNEAVQAIQHAYGENVRELQETYQKAGNLDGFLAARKEMERFHKEKNLADPNIVHSLDALKWIQESHIHKIKQVTYTIAQKYIAMLEPQMEDLTRQNKIPEAIQIKQSIEALKVQYEDAFQLFEPVSPLDGEGVTDADTLAAFCNQNEELATRTLQGKTLTVAGKIKDVTPDFSNSGILHVILDTRSDRKVDFQFKSGDNNWKISTGRRAKGYVLHSLRSPDSPSLIIEVDQPIELIGTFSGVHLNVILTESLYSETASINQPLLIPAEPAEKKPK